MVGAIMIGQGKKYRGIAPNAQLYSAAIGSPRNISQQEECLTTQNIAEQNGGDLRAINFSFGEPLERDPRKRPILDGNALLTQCIDWSSRVHNVLYVVAGNQGKGGIPIPTDNFNGINVAYTMMRNGTFSKVDFSNLSENPVGIAKKLQGREINTGNRRSVGLLAPGSRLRVYNEKGVLTEATGTSFAAPQVTATVALLQEYGDRQIKIDPQRWTTNARQSQVMRAVLLNSADKIADRGDGLFLGMKHTLLTKRNQTWLNSEAFSSRSIPLDYQLGAGQLNAFRAYQQFSAGESKPKFPVKAIGWNYDRLRVGQYHDYEIDQDLILGSFISITLTWERLVELNDRNRNKRYDIGETFKDRGLNNLDIYLMRSTDNDIKKSIWSSQSKTDSIEHIFHSIPATGRYKIRVHFPTAVNLKEQNYGIAWWSKN
jgi:hypothetical protein